MMNKITDTVTKIIVPWIMAFFISVSSIAQNWWNFEKYMFTEGEDVVNFLPQTIAPPQDEIYLIDRGNMNDSEFVMITLYDIDEL